MDDFETSKEYKMLRDEIIEKYFNKLNKEQVRAVLTDRESVLVSACPGAGKTQVIINRIIYLNTFGNIYRSNKIPKGLCENDLEKLAHILKNTSPLMEQKLPHILTCDAVKLKNILVITFTKMAAIGMKERYRNISGSLESPFFGTFHSLFYKILSRYHSGIKIISEIEAYKTVRATLESYIDSVNEDKIRSVINDISLYKNKRLLNLEHEVKTDWKVFMDCYNNYEGYKLKNDLMDFDDILINSIKLFKNNKSILEEYRGFFKNILVDEFQDCDSQQIYLLKILSKGNKLFAVGDEDQCIYGFRGSRPDCMVDFDIHFENGVKFYLSKNYRSRSNIVKISKSVINKNKCRNEKSMNAVRNELGQIEIIGCSTEKEQAEKIAEVIKSLQCSCALKEIAVLFRTNKESQRLISILLKNKIKFHILDKKYNFFEQGLCKDIISYFKLSIDPCDKESFLRIINKPYRYISKTKIEKLRNYSFCRNCFSFLMDFSDMNLMQIKNVHYMEKRTARLKGMKPADALKCILESIGYWDYIRKHDEYNEVLRELEDIISDFKSIKEFLAFIDEYSGETSKSLECDDAVTLSTIHGVKGLEYKNLFIANCSRDNMPHLNSLGNIEEERRLFYVGITRAVDNLYLLYPMVFKGNSCSRSPFIDECAY